MSLVILSQQQNEARLRAVNADAPLPAPVIPAALDGGLGWDDIERDPLALLIVQCGPWADLITGDIVRVFWGPAGEVATFTATEGGNNIINVPVLVSKIRNAGEGELAVYYTILTAFGEETVPSQTLDVRVKYSAPGGRDPQPDTPYLNENLAAPVVTPNPVPAQASSATVTVAPWLNMTAGDDLTLSWGGVFISHPPLSAADVGRPVILTVTRDVLEQAGGGSELPVTYSVRDVVNNWSGYAPYATPDVQIEDPGALEAPDLDEAADGELDVTSLAETDILTVLVPRYVGIAVGDQVMVAWRGRTAAGQQVDWDSSTYTVPAKIPFVLEFAVPATAAISLAQGSLAVSYSVINTGKKSALLRLRVTGEVQTLAPPAVAEAIGGVLDPADAQQGATVVVPAWSGMEAGDQVQVVWSGTEASGAMTYWEDNRAVSGNGAGKEMHFVVPTLEVSRLLNGSVRVTYRVETFSKRAGGGYAPQALLPSPVLTLAVKSAAAQPDLPAPAVDGVVSGYLPPSLGSTIARVPAFVGMTKGDRIDLSWTGAASFSDWLLVNRPGEQEFYIDSEYIRGNLNQEVTVGYTVNGGAQKSALLRFTVGEAVVTLPAPAVPEAVNGELDSGLGAASIVPPAGYLSQGESVTGTFNGQNTATAVAGLNGKVTLVVTQAMIAAAAGKAVSVTYTVVRNGTPVVSDALTLSVTAAQRLPAPVVPEAESGMLNGWAEAATIVPPSGYLSQGESVTGTFNGQNTAAAVAGPGGTVTLAVTEAMIAAAAGKTISVTYTVVRNGTQVVSDALSLWVTAAEQPPAPVVPEAVEGTLDGGLGAATIVTVNGVLRPGELVTGTFNGQNTAAAVASPVGTVVLAVTQAMIAAAAGKTVSVTYTMVRNGTQVVSRALTLSVTGAQRLPAPVVPEAVNGKLDGELGAASIVPPSGYLNQGESVTGTFNGQNTAAAVAGPGGTVTLAVTQAMIASAAGKAVSVTYTVVRNGTQVVSDALTLSVTVAQRLPAPVVPEAVNGKLDGGLEAASIVPPSAYLNEGEEIAGVFDGSWTDSTFVGPNGVVVVTVPKAMLQQAAGKTVSVRYSVVRNGKINLSEALTLSVTDAQRLPAPAVPEAVSGTLDGGLGAATIVPPSGYLNQGESVTGTFNGQNTAVAVAGPGGTVTLAVTQAMIASAAGKAVSVTYTVVRNGKQSMSDALTVTVSAARTLLAPTVPQAAGGVISAPDAGATIQVPAGVSLKAGERVRGVAGSLYTAEVSVTTPGQTLNLTLTPAQTRQLAGQGMKAWFYQVYVNGNWLNSLTINITVKETTITDNLEDAAIGEVGSLIRPGYQITKADSKTRLMIAGGENSPPYLSNKSLQIWNHNCRLTLTSPCTSLRFGYRSMLYPNGNPDVYVYSSAGLERTDKLPGNGGVARWYDCAPLTSGRKISEIVFSGTGVQDRIYNVIDNVTIFY